MRFFRLPGRWLVHSLLKNIQFIDQISGYLMVDVFFSNKNLHEKCTCAWKQVKKLENCGHNFFAPHIW